MANANRKGRTMSDQTLQHMLSTGEWIDIAPDYVDCYIQRCVDHGRLDSREAVLAALEAGREVRNDPAAGKNCRDSVDCYHLHRTSLSLLV